MKYSMKLNQIRHLPIGEQRLLYYGSTNNILTVKATTNTSSSPRTATLTFEPFYKHTDNILTAYKKTITVTQVGATSTTHTVAFETNGEEIAPRFVVPGERAMYWVKQPGEIAFETAAEEAPVTQEIYWGDLLAQLKGSRVVDYEYKGDIYNALPISVLLGELDLGAKPVEFVTIKSADGLTKTEKYDIFAAQLLVFEGTPDAPLYTGPELPAGMRVKNVESFQVGGVLVLTTGGPQATPTG